MTVTSSPVKSKNKMRVLKVIKKTQNTREEKRKILDKMLEERAQKNMKRNVSSKVK